MPGSLGSNVSLHIQELFMKRSTLIVLAALVTVLLASPAIPQADSEAIEHSGMCDASAAVAVGRTLFVVASDEDNVLRVYRANKPGKPVHTFDLTSFLKPDPKYPEADIEGATRVGDRVYWVTSHGTNKNGKQRPTRHRLFATDVKVAADKVTITPVGTPYKNLIKDLNEAPHLKDLKLGEAARKPPEGVGGLNIEGLSATPQGALLIAFRNPIPSGKALLIPLENPKEVIEGRAAKLGAPIRLSLGGLGVRSIEYFEARGKYLIVAGPHGDEGDFKLYQWSGLQSEEPELLKQVNFKDLRPEALVIYPGEKTKVQVLSDDGTKQVDGKDCKEAKPGKQSFRSSWVTP
jgi:hypothetical protein